MASFISKQPYIKLLSLHFKLKKYRVLNFTLICLGMDLKKKFFLTSCFLLLCPFHLKTQVFLQLRELFSNYMILASSLCKPGIIQTNGCQKLLKEERKSQNRERHVSKEHIQDSLRDTVCLINNENSITLKMLVKKKKIMKNTHTKIMSQLNLGDKGPRKRE